jgi:hypothetical protein
MLRFSLQTFVESRYVAHTWRCSRIPRPTPRWENDIKMNLREMRGKGVEWTEPALENGKWRALVSTEKSLRVQYNKENSLTSWETVSFSIRTVLQWVRRCMISVTNKNLSYGRRFKISVYITTQLHTCSYELPFLTMSDIITTQNINFSSIITSYNWSCSNDTGCEVATISIVYSYIYSNTALFTAAPNTFIVIPHCSLLLPTHG